MDTKKSRANLRRTRDFNATTYALECTGDFVRCIRALRAPRLTLLPGSNASKAERNTSANSPSLHTCFTLQPRICATSG